ncbi:calcium-activated chloride channel regulator 1-like [Ptychodera flava]|uniref:calcium-activated chloride channel regulator 1-like n=1 Tax=Ptychodera flava TaxID=63121 RepID=UPI003969EAA8
MVGKLQTFLFVFCFIAPTSTSRNAVSLVDNTYTNVLIAINENVEEDVRLISVIKDIFTDASARLYEATRQRAAFGDITILVPKTWSDNATYGVATTEMYDTANVIIDHPSPDYEDNPYTKQTKPCGEKGEYIHLTPKWVGDREYSNSNWGESAKVIVHEWSHLQWGVFDEYTGIEEQFYLDPSGRVEPSRCSEAITGQSLDIYNYYKECNKDPESGVLPAPGCVFFPDLENTGTGSYLYANFIDSVVEFCHSDPKGNPKSKHNPLALNEQNKQCEYRSAWDVMSQSADFYDANPAREGMNTIPIFNVVKETEFRTVLIMDLSGSMDLNDRAELQYQAASKYIGYTLPLGSWVGIVEFETTATTLANLTKIVDEQAREDLIAKLPRYPFGGTCIGCGLQTGVEVLENSVFKEADGGVLFLITDGDENVRPLIEEVLPEILAKNVIVDTLALSDAADPKLVNLSNATNGRSCWYSEGENSTALHDCFTSSVTERTSSGAETPVQLTSYKVKVPRLGRESGSIFIDSTIGRETYFFFFWDFGSNLAVEVTLTRPNGTTITSGDPQYEKDDDSHSIVISVDGIAEVGRWEYEIYNPDFYDQVVEINVDSKAVNTSTPPIRLSPSLSTDFVDVSPPMLVIYAEVSQGHSPVLQANVVATVERPSPHGTVQLQLLDSGTGADIIKDDGIYSGYFVDFVETTCGSACRYSVQVTANNAANNAQFQVTRRFGAMPRNISLIPEKTAATPVGDFDRVSSGGVIQLSADVNYTDWNNTNADPFSPSRIVDLRVTETSILNETVTLTWTATGDDFDQGTASSYDLRYSTDFNEVLYNFTNCEQTEESNLTAGTLMDPAESGVVEMLTVRMPSSGAGFTYYFAIRAIDDVGNAGQSSNVAQASIVAAAPIAQTTMSSTQQPSGSTETVSATTAIDISTTADIPGPVQSGLESWELALIITASVLAATLLCAFVGLCVYLHKAQKTTKVQPLKSTPSSSMPDVELAETHVDTIHM